MSQISRRRWGSGAAVVKETERGFTGGIAHQARPRRKADGGRVWSGSGCGCGQVNFEAARGVWKQAPRPASPSPPLLLLFLPAV